MRYDAPGDEWTLLVEGLAPNARRLDATDGPEGTALVVWDGATPDGGAMLIAGDDGEVIDLANPGGEGAIWPQDVCSSAEGPLLLSVPHVDLNTDGAAAFVLETPDGDAPAWSDAFEVPEEAYGATSSSAICTDDGLALLGVAGEGDRAASLSFDGRTWTTSVAPVRTDAPAFVPGPEGVVFASGELWRHDDDGTWRFTGVRTDPEPRGSAVVDDAHITVVRPDAEAPRLELVRIDGEGVDR